MSRLIEVVKDTAADLATTTLPSVVGGGAGIHAILQALQGKYLAATLEGVVSLASFAGLLGARRRAVNAAGAGFEAGIEEGFVAGTRAGVEAANRILEEEGIDLEIDIEGVVRVDPGTLLPDQFTTPPGRRYTEPDPPNYTV